MSTHRLDYIINPLNSNNTNRNESVTSLLFDDDCDQQQFQQIYGAVTISNSIQSKLICKLIAEFATGHFETCANELCSADISILNQYKNTNNVAHSISFYQQHWSDDAYLCNQCISFIHIIPRGSLLKQLKKLGISSIEDLLQFERKKYILFHQTSMDREHINSVFVDIKSDIKDYQPPEDDAVSIWDLKQNWKKQLKDNFRTKEILESLKRKLPEIRKQIYPKQLDLNTFSEQHGSLIFDICKTGDLPLIKYFIETEKLNPHYVYPTNINVMHSVSVSPWTWQSAETLKYLAGFGCDLELVYIGDHGKVKRAFGSFVGNDDCAKYRNTKMMISFGFHLDEMAETYSYNDEHHVFSIRNRIALGFGEKRIDKEFSQIELLKPKNSMNEEVLNNTKILIKRIVVNISNMKQFIDYDINWICNDIFECMNIRDICKIYQYTVNVNGWNKNCEWL